MEWDDRCECPDVQTGSIRWTSIMQNHNWTARLHNTASWCYPIKSVSKLLDNRTIYIAVVGLIVPLTATKFFLCLSLFPQLFLSVRYNSIPQTSKADIFLRSVKLNQTQVRKYFCSLLEQIQYSTACNFSGFYNSQQTESPHVYQVTASGSAAIVTIVHWCCDDLVQLHSHSLPTVRHTSPPRTPTLCSAASLYMMHFIEKYKRLSLQIDFSGSNNSLH